VLAVSDENPKMTEAAESTAKVESRPTPPGGGPQKSEQGRLARLAVFWTLAALLFYGCVSLFRTLSAAFGGVLGNPFAPSMKTIPVLGLPFNAALLITAVVLAGAWYGLYRWQQTPRVSNLLTETEAELRKVTWPTFSEAVNSSIVVIFCVVFLMAFLAGADWLLGQWTTLILLGGGR
jgi:preprotein translocase SecE subunit